MKIALVITVKNEERLLRENLRYHNAIGVDKAYVYFDRTTDGGKEAAKDLVFVEVRESVDSKKFESVSCLKKFTSQAGEHHTARQCLNTYDAVLRAEKENFDWLISIDADELVVSRIDEVPDLKGFFTEVKPEVDAVNFPVREVLQAKKHYNEVFREETRFKTIRNFKRYSENIFKSFYNPASGKFEKFVYWYGHHTGKMAIRLNRNLIPHNPHKFVNEDGERINTISKGLLLHYHAYDAEDFIKKYRNFELHPSTYLSGKKVENIKLLFIEVVNRSNFNKDQLEKYYEKYLMFSEKEIKNLIRNRVYYFFPRKKPVLMRITAVSKTLEKLES